MGIEFDPSPQLTQYAHPKKLVTSAWLGAKLGSPDLKVLESDEDSLLYDIGHIPTAHRVNWSADLNDSVCRDFVDGEAFAQLMNSRGISRDDTVVIYGDQSNLWAVYTLWVFELFGHPDVRLLDGGRDAWMQEEKETSYDVPNRTTNSYPVINRDDVTHRVFADELQANLDSLQISRSSLPRGLRRRLRLAEFPERQQGGAYSRCAQPRHREKPVPQLSFPQPRGIGCRAPAARSLRPHRGVLLLRSQRCARVVHADLSSGMGQRPRL